MWLLHMRDLYTHLCADRRISRPVYLQGSITSAVATFDHAPPLRRPRVALCLASLYGMWLFPQVSNLSRRTKMIRDKTICRPLLATVEVFLTPLVLHKRIRPIYYCVLRKQVWPVFFIFFFLSTKLINLYTPSILTLRALQWFAARLNPVYCHWHKSCGWGTTALNKWCFSVNGDALAPVAATKYIKLNNSNILKFWHFWLAAVYNFGHPKLYL